MNYYYFIGIDAAKYSFDATILRGEDEQRIDYKQFSNDNKGIREMLKWVKSFKIRLKEAIFCVENMGVYSSLLAVESTNKGYNLALACPLSIKKSMGIARGKNDKVDSQRIAYYALKYYRKLTLYRPESDAILELSNWLIVREHFVKEKVSLGNMISTMELNKRVKLDKQLSLLKKSYCECLKKIDVVEKNIERAINSDESVKINYNLLTSIKGVGLIVATVMLTSTANFTKFSNSRQYACYCGVAPFEHSSGISIRGKTSVSKQASLKIKNIISKATLSAQRHDKQLKNYTLRKLEEGKNKFSVRNAVTNKIIARCFAVVKRGTPYVSLQI